MKIPTGVSRVIIWHAEEVASPHVPPGKEKNGRGLHYEQLGTEMNKHTISGFKSCTEAAPSNLMALTISCSRIWVIFTTPETP
jgi:hypothetical protein